MAASVRDNTATLEAAVEERTEQLRRIAYLDPMTGILNRCGFAEAFGPRAGECAMRSVRLGLLLLDVDRFKSINDARGHSIGDAVIREVAQRLAAVVRKQDICARWGGDEFVVLVADCTEEALAELSARIMEALRAQPVVLPDGTKLRITTSIGGHLLGADETLDAAAHMADLALYAAKRAGRNRTVMYDAAVHAEGASRVA